jgi:hypothetical protein
MVRLLAQLNSNPDWRELYGPPSLRLRDQELVLRVLAFYMRQNEYSSPLKQFLNKFLSDHRSLSDFPRDEIEKLFTTACHALSDADARTSVRRAGQRINVAFLEAVIVGYMRMIAAGRNLKSEQIKTALTSLTSDEEMARTTAAATTTNESVRTRFTKAERAFAG